MSAPPADAGPMVGEHDADRWREVTALRREHRGWVIIWLAPARGFRAYRRLPGTRHDTTVSAPTAEGLAAAIIQAEQAVPRGPGHGRSQQ
jgi:hypothetical protein